MFVPPLLSRCSLQLKRQRLKLMKSWCNRWLWVALPGVRVSCYSSSSLSCPYGCSARFCSASCFATHQASCPFVTFAKPVMMTFHESLKGASIGLAVARQGVPVLFNPCSIVFQRSFSATGCFTAGSMHPLARSPTVVLCAPWFEYFQHIELNVSRSRAALGRNRAQVRDAGRVLSGLVSHFRQALYEVEYCVPIACPWLDLLRVHFGPVCLVAQLCRAPFCSVQTSLWPGFSFRDHAHGLFFFFFF